MRAAISCSCGRVRGEVATARANRVGCYCDDCQAFAHYLKRPDLLDAQGRSDIVQLPPSAMKITQGEANVRCVRLGPKGLYRFHAACCATPLGNVHSATLPFVGLQAVNFRCDGQDPDALFGKPRGAILGQFAIGEPPPGTKGIGAGLMISTIAKVVGWKLSGRAWPHPFFDRPGKLRYPVTALSREERERLRPLCGSSPSAAL